MPHCILLLKGSDAWEPQKKKKKKKKRERGNNMLKFRTTRGSRCVNVPLLCDIASFGLVDRLQLSVDFTYFYSCGTVPVTN